VRARAAEDEGAGAEGVSAPEDANALEADASDAWGRSTPDAWDSSAREEEGSRGWDCGGGGWVEFGGGLT
jgi:hypothetical protein